jgi:hypothetical protein
VIVLVPFSFLAASQKKEEKKVSQQLFIPLWSKMCERGKEKCERESAREREENLTRENSC